MALSPDGIVTAQVAALRTAPTVAGVSCVEGFAASEELLKGADGRTRVVTNND